ncbi:hypothetical protein MCERE19_03479 [Spirosomataceae bacterium]|jgi:hypothetical protein
MSSLELRSNFHSLIDRIDNEQLLQKFYEVLLNANNSNLGNLWSKLSDLEQKELLEIDQETDDLENTVSNEVAFDKYQKWL